jgi:transcriptional regulator with XRE-family HTH domain
MTVHEEIGRLAEEAEDLAEFIVKACALLGKGVTRASAEAGLSKNTFSSWVKGKRRPSAHSAWRAARYFGVREDQILKLAGIEFSTMSPDDVEELAGDVHRILGSLDDEEVKMWMEYGELLLLRRQRRMMEEAQRGEVEGQRN